MSSFLPAHEIRAGATITLIALDHERNSLAGMPVDTRGYEIQASDVELATTTRIR
jgi:hypothetical protein